MLIFSCSSFFFFFLILKWVTWSQQPAKHNINIALKHCSFPPLEILRLLWCKREGRIAHIFQWKHLIWWMCIFILMKSMFWAGLSAAVSMLWASWPMILSTRTKDESFYTKLPMAVRSSIPNEIQKSLCIRRGIHSYSHRSFLLKSFLTSEERLEMKSVLETASALGGTCSAPSGVCSGLCKSPDPLGHHSLSPPKISGKPSAEARKKSPDCSLMNGSSKL